MGVWHRVQLRHGVCLRQRRSLFTVVQLRQLGQGRSKPGLTPVGLAPVLTPCSGFTRVGERAPILKAWCQIATSGRRHLPVPYDAPISAFETIVTDYPVFRIDPFRCNDAAALPP